MRRASGRSTKSSTRRSSSRIATRVSRAVPLMSISRFKARALDAGPAGRRGRRLSRGQGPRSLPRAGGSRRAGDARVDRGGEPPDGGVSGGNPRARADQGAAAPAVGLSQVRRAVPQGRPLLLFQERRLAEPVGALQAGGADGGPGGAAGPESPVGV